MPVVIFTSSSFSVVLNAYKLFFVEAAHVLFADNTFTIYRPFWKLTYVPELCYKRCDYSVD